MIRLFMARFALAACCFCIAYSVAAQTPPPFAPNIIPLPRAGTMSHESWNFSWNVGSQSEGLELRNVSYRGVRMLFKASMPVVRDKYQGDGSSARAGCGPYAVRLNWNNMVVPAGVPAGTTDKVIARIDSGNVLEIGVYARIGGYDLYQAWYFHPDGRMRPVLYSKGWACSDMPTSQRNHRHHPYWRLDFDIESADLNIMHAFFRLGVANFYRPIFQNEEGFTARGPIEPDAFWTVGRTNSPRHVLIQYSDNEYRDFDSSPWWSFSTKDEAARLYRASEDAGWLFGALGHLGYDVPPENLDGQDVVFWSVGHLTHIWTPVDQISPQWHSTGPVIQPVW